MEGPARLSSNGRSTVDNFRIVKCAQKAVKIGVYLTFLLQKVTWEKLAADSGKRGQKKSRPLGQLFPQCHGLLESRAPEGRHQLRLVIVSCRCSFVKPQFSIAKLVATVCTTGGVGGFPGGSFQLPGVVPTSFASVFRGPRPQLKTTTAPRRKRDPPPNSFALPGAPSGGGGAGGRRGEAHSPGAAAKEEPAQGGRAAVHQRRGTRDDNRAAKAGPPTPPPGTKRAAGNTPTAPQRQGRGGRARAANQAGHNATRLDGGPRTRGAARKTAARASPARSRGARTRLKTTRPGWNAPPCGVANKGELPQRGSGPERSWGAESAKAQHTPQSAPAEPDPAG